MSNRNDLTMLVDHSLCIGCEACTAVCKQIYDVTPNIFRTKIKEHSTGRYYSGISAGSMRKIYKKDSCFHCTEASCVMACPTGSCHKNEDGLVVINDKLCISCNYCAKNCPYHVISYDRPNSVVDKCSLCETRIKEGLEPFCSLVCPAQAVKFGSREEMINYSENRLNDLKRQGYIDANIYGVTELGGQRVLNLLDESPDKYGLPVNPEIPITLRLWSSMPLRPIALLAAAIVVGFNFLHSRKYNAKADEVREKNKIAPHCILTPGIDEDDDIEAIEQKKEEDRKG